MTRTTERPAVTTSPTTDLDDATALRHRLADQLAANGHIRTSAVGHALRTVPGTAWLGAAAVITARGGDGTRALGPAHRSRRRHRGNPCGGDAAELTERPPRLDSSHPTYL